MFDPPTSSSALLLRPILNASQDPSPTVGPLMVHQKPLRGVDDVQEYGIGDGQQPTARDAHASRGVGGSISLQGYLNPTQPPVVGRHGSLGRVYAGSSSRW